MKIIKLTFITAVLMGLVACQNTITPSQMYKNHSAEQIFTTGELYVANGEYMDGIKAFEALDALYPFSANSEQAQLDLIYAYYQSDDYTSASSTAERFIRLYPRSVHVDYAYYIKGLANFNQDRGWFQRYLPVDVSKRDPGTMKQAYEDFKTLANLFPNSTYAPDARQRMIYLRDLFARNDLVIAQYYYDRKAYVGAINRTNNLLLHYQSSSSVPGALLIQVKAYKALSMTADANQALQVLELNYPSSVAAKSARKAD